jgi:uncharacterized membrane protein (DUF4010 family)
LLHRWLTRITWVELRSGFLLAAMTFMLLPLLPDRTVDPLNVLNPYQLWLMTILIAAVSFAGYVIVKMAGPRTGLILAALLGGLFASTAVTIALARLASANGGHTRLLAGGILASGAVMVLRVLAVTTLINSGLSVMIGPTLIAAALCMGILALILVKAGGQEQLQGKREFELRNPFDLMQVLRFGALLAFVTFAIALAKARFGDSGVMMIAAISGLADVDAVTLSVARLQEASPLAAQAIIIAVIMNTAAKAVYAGLIGGMRLGFLTMGSSAMAIAAAGAVWLSQ